MHEPSTVTLPILAALVNMSTKYDARTVVKEIVERLKPFYPDTLENFDALKGPKSKMAAVTLFTESTRHDDFRLLALARKCEAPILLPTLFFSLRKTPTPRNSCCVRYRCTKRPGHYYCRPRNNDERRIPARGLCPRLCDHAEERNVTIRIVSRENRRGGGGTTRIWFI